LKLLLIKGFPGENFSPVCNNFGDLKNVFNMLNSIKQAQMVIEKWCAVE
jgi:hypothetical protein